MSQDHRSYPIFEGLVLLFLSVIIVSIVYRADNPQNHFLTVNQPTVETRVEKAIPVEVKQNNVLREKTYRDTIGAESLRAIADLMERRIAAARTSDPLVMIVDTRDTLIYTLKQTVRMQDTTILTLRKLDLSNGRLVALKDTLLAIQNDKLDAALAEAKKQKRGKFKAGLLGGAIGFLAGAVTTLSLIK